MDGRRIIADASLDKIPLHVKTGAILPLVPISIESFSDYVNEIELRIHRCNNNRFTLYIDDNESYEKAFTH